MRAHSLLLAALIAAPGPLHADRRSTRPDAFPAPVVYLRHLLHLDGKPTAVSHEVVVSSDSRALTIHLSDGAALSFALTRGRALVNGSTVGHYAPGGDLERAWQDLLADAARLPTAMVVARLHTWAPSGLAGDDASAAAALESRLGDLAVEPGTAPEPQAIPPAAAGGLSIDLSDLSDLAHLEPRLYRAEQLSGPDLRITVPGGQARLGNYSVGSGQTVNGHLLVLRGDADIYGTLTGNVATVDGDIVLHRGGTVQGSVLAVGGQVREAGGRVTGDVVSLSDAFPPPESAGRTVLRPWQRILTEFAGVLGVFVSLAVIGFGLVAFARPQLEVVGDTVAHSFGRAFVVGLLGQILLVPTFGMLVVGLVLTVVGILLVPFAVAVYLLLAIVAIVGGTLGVTHAMGETWTRRRLAHGGSAFGMNSYSYLLLGLAFLLALWLTDVLFGWVPVAGALVQGAAILVTWVLATAGFGAALLSRAGLRDAFTGRILPAEALTDEYLWATPQFGVPAVQRPTRTPPPKP
ncbi:MAG TPA: polymer-forming cytoskeletal protein [Gemmatimonadales bacterium]|nr:polymer-forming cytoskeletal protein [Gemmatimonadales bacterium]